jgi:oligoribonuclease
VRQFQAVIGHDVSKLQMDPFVRNMHTNSGLLAEVAASKTTLQESDDFLADLCKNELSAKPKSLTLAGNSIGQFDYQWVWVHLPKFASYLHHRVFDVSPLQRAHQEWLGTEPIRAPAHRALDDVKASLAACKAWREQAGL